MAKRNKQTFSLAPPPCVKSAPTDRRLVRFRFTSDGPDTGIPMFLSMFKSAGPVCQSTDCLRSACGPVRLLSVGPCPTDVNRETDRFMSGPLSEPAFSETYRGPHACRAVQCRVKDDFIFLWDHANFDRKF
jgi:hypothetical protein